jgi:hypothetical protein
MNVAALRREFAELQRSSLAAVELGYSVGTIYTSLTGAFTSDGAGSVQLAALAALLYHCGYTRWDLGMSMLYKTHELGCSSVPRGEWTALVSARRAVQPQGRDTTREALAASYGVWAPLAQPKASALPARAKLQRDVATALAAPPGATAEACVMLDPAEASAAPLSGGLSGLADRVYNVGWLVSCLP